MPKKNYKNGFIAVKTPQKNFREHLELSENERIIFSGKFGIGKTSFLQEFFYEEKNKYFTIHLAPVNYSVATNEDIFKFIKYDIIKHLITEYNLLKVLKEESQKKTFWEKTNLIASLFYTKNHELSSLISNIVLVGKTFTNKPEFEKLALLSSFVKVSEDILKEYTTIQKDENPIIKAIEEFTSKFNTNYLYENDLATLFIQENCSLLASYILENDEVKELEKPRKKVLIIDDLDRIDPAHIFRLFNIFSAHLDYDEHLSNKFNFDHIIFVCDIENIRQIFKHQYGTETDFNGYIDKFFSRRVFYFDNREAIRNIIENHLSTVKSLKEYQKELLVDILDGMIVANTINLRSFFKLLHGYKSSNKSVFIQGKEYASSNFVIVEPLRLLTSILGTSQGLLDAIKETSNLEIINLYPKLKVNEKIEFLIPILGYENLKGWELNYNNQHIWSNPLNITQLLEFTTTPQSSMDGGFIYRLSKNPIKEKDFFVYLTETVRILIKLNAL